MSEPSIFMCGHCGVEFEYEYDEAETLAAYRRDFPEDFALGNDRDTACPDCYSKALFAMWTQWNAQHRAGSVYRQQGGL